ncbi:uncharacterized protein [Apostichopus japonicus]|uniref:uncharacterized protein n=1 Tax=Stichopus japonicus TaxID=307972 RepID=UPI003AB38922
MATANPSNLDEEILLCSICLDTLEEPKMLPCLHRFCKKCLSQVVNRIATRDTIFNCPTCRQQTDVPESGADGFKGDFLLEAILESRKLEITLKDKHKKQICSSCETTKQVVAICPDCGGFLCNDCMLCHKSMKMLRLHTHLVTLKDIEAGTVTFNAQTVTSLSKTPKCPTHKDMPLHISCQTCDKLICPVCAPIHHPGHKFEEISTAADRMKEKFQSSTKKIRQRISNDALLTKAFEELEEDYIKLESTVNEYSEAHKDKIKKEMKSALRRLKEKKLKIKQKAERKLQIFKTGKDFIMFEIHTRKMFSKHFIEKSNKYLTNVQSKVENICKTSRVLTETADNWSVLSTAPEFLTACSGVRNDSRSMRQDLAKCFCYSDYESGSDVEVECSANDESEGETDSEKGSIPSSGSDVEVECSTSDESEGETDSEKGSIPSGEEKDSEFDEDEMKETMSSFLGLYRSPFIDEEWHQLHVTSIDEAITDLRAFSDKYILTLAIAADGNAEVYTFNTETEDTLTTGNYDTLELPFEDTEGKVLIAKMNHTIEDSLVAIINNSSDLYYIDNDGEDERSPFELSTNQTEVTCITQGLDALEVIVGICGTTSLYRCNLQAEEISNIPIKVDDMAHPVSLSSSKDGNLLLCDGKRKAVAINDLGEQLYQYHSRHDDDRPMKICADQQGLVYVLWERLSLNIPDSNMDNIDEDGSDESQKSFPSIGSSESDEEDEDVPKVVMQYTQKGTFISEFTVDVKVTMMAPITPKEGFGGIAVATPRGELTAFYMNARGINLSRFVQDKEDTLKCEDSQKETASAKVDDKDVTVKV